MNRFQTTVVSAFGFRIIDSLLYSYSTTYIIDRGIKNNLIVLMAVSIGSVVIFFDNRKSLILSRINLFKWLLIMIINYFLLLVLTFNSVASIVLAVFIHTLAYDSVSTLMNSKIIDDSENLQMGLINYSTLNTLTTLAGFALGSSLYKLSINLFGLLLIFISLLTFLLILFLTNRCLRCRYTTKAKKSISIMFKKFIQKNIS